MQTQKLFEVCRSRGLPILTFVNKWDRPGLEPARAHRRHRVEARPDLHPGHVAGGHRGRLPRRRGSSQRRLHPVHTYRSRLDRGARGDRAARPRPGRGGHQLDREPGRARARLRRRTRQRDVPGGRDDADVLRLGPHELRCAPAARLGDRRGAEPVRARIDVEGDPRALDSPFSGFVFKVQANMDRSHRDRIAFVRVCSGRFERGMVVTHDGPASRSPPSTPTRCSVRSARRSRRRSPATSSGSSTRTTCGSATRCGSTTR